MKCYFEKLVDEVAKEVGWEKIGCYVGYGEELHIGEYDEGMEIKTYIEAHIFDDEKLTIMDRRDRGPISNKLAQMVEDKAKQLGLKVRRFEDLTGEELKRYFV